MEKKYIIFILWIIIVSLLITLTFASPNDPAEFGNLTVTTCWVGGSAGIVNCTGNAIFDGDVTATNFYGTFTGNSSIWSRAGTFIFPTNIGDRVGIGTTNPIRTLDVNGITRISGGGLLVGDVVPGNPANPPEGEVWVMDDDIDVRFILGEGTSSGESAGMKWNSAGNYLLIYHSSVGTGSIFLDSSGNVGIGTSSPGAKLHVSAGAQAIWTNYSTDYTVLRSDVNDVRSWQIDNIDDDFRFYDGTQYSVTFEADTGRVGIGTSSPGYKLDIKSTAQEMLLLNSSSHSVLQINADNGGVGSLNAYLRFSINDVNKWDLTAIADGNLRIYDYVNTETPFLIEAGATTNTFVIDSNSRVGIGTDSPGEKLDVDAGTVASNQVGASINADIDTNPGVYTGTLMLSAKSSPGNASLIFSDTVAKFASIKGEREATNYYGNLRFSTRDSGSLTERMVITHDGLVGIGTSSPTSKLNIDSSTSAAAMFEISRKSTNDALRILNYNGDNIAFNLQTTNDDWTTVKDVMSFKTNQNLVGIGYPSLSGLGFDGLIVNGLVGIGTSSPTSLLEVYTSSGNTIQLNNGYMDIYRGGDYLRFDGAHGASGGDPVISTNGTGGLHLGGSSDTKHVTILSDGKVGIGTSSPDNLLHLKADVPVLNIESSNAAGEEWTIRSTYGGAANTGTLDIRDESGDIWMAFQQNEGSERGSINIPNGGNFGIGTISPSVKFHVSDGGSVPTLGTHSADGAIIQHNTLTGDNARLAIIAGTAAASIIDFGDSGNIDAGQIHYNHNSQKLFFGNLGDRMTIDSSGNVGITETSPDAKLHIQGGNLYIERGGEINFIAYDGANKRAGIKATDASPFNELQFFSGGYSEAMRIDGTGKVGIGTTDPDTKLHIHEGSSGANFLKITNTGTGEGATDGFIVGIGADETAQIWQYENLDMIFATNNVEKMRIYASNRVEIGAGAWPTSTVGNTAGRHGILNDDPILVIYNTKAKANDNEASIMLGALANTANKLAGGQIIGRNPNSANDGGELVFKTSVSGGGFTDAMYIDALQNVGIGTDSPSTLLHLFGETPILTLQDDDSSGDEFSAIQFGSAGDIDFAGIMANRTAGLLGFCAGGGCTGMSNAKLIITSAGDVGIGDPAPERSLHVLHATEDLVAIFESGDDNAHIEIRDDSDSAYILNKDSKMSLGFANSLSTANLNIDSLGRVGIGTISPGTILHLKSSDLTTLTIEGGLNSNFPLIQLMDKETGGSNWNIENGREGDGKLGFYNGGTKMVIQSDGNVGIGTVSPDSDFELNVQTDAVGITSGAVTPDAGMAAGDLYVEGHMEIDGLPAVTSQRNTMCISDAGVLSIDVAGNNCDLSSARYKHDIKELDIDGLGLVMQFKPTSFIRNSDLTQRTQYGFIAEDLALVDPNLALFEKYDSTLGYNTLAKYDLDAIPYSISKYGIMAVLTKAIQEQQEQIEFQNSEIIALKAENQLFKLAFCKEFPQNELCIYNGK